MKTRAQGLAKNTAQLVTLFALSNPRMARRHLLTNAGEVCACNEGNGCREVLAAAKKHSNERMIGAFLIDLPLAKSAGTEVSQKCMATSNHPWDVYDSYHKGFS